MRNWTVVIRLLVIFFISYCLFTIKSIWHYPNDSIQHADVAIVLGAAVYKNEPSPVFEQRIRHAINLYKDGYVEAILFTGGKARGDELAESEAARNFAIRHGVSANEIYIETVSTITEENLLQANLIMNQQQWNKALIVSDPLHLRRAMLIAESYKMDVVSSPTPTTLYKTWRTKIPFLLREAFYTIGYQVTNPFR